MKVPNLVALGQTYFIQFFVTQVYSHNKKFACNITIQPGFFLTFDLKNLFLVGIGKGWIANAGFYGAQEITYMNLNE